MKNLSARVDALEIQLKADQESGAPAKLTGIRWLRSTGAQQQAAVRRLWEECNRETASRREWWLE